MKAIISLDRSARGHLHWFCGDCGASFPIEGGYYSKACVNCGYDYSKYIFWSGCPCETPGGGAIDTGTLELKVDASIPQDGASDV